jgi:hypothetical protein
MNLLNPFDRRGKGESSFTDRAAIAVLWVLIMFFSVLIPILVYKWYKSATPRKRTLLLVVLCTMILLGHLFDTWVNS